MTLPEKFVIINSHLHGHFLGAAINTKIILLISHTAMPEWIRVVL